MNEAIALEVRTLCRRAAEPIRPGEGVKSQIRRAWQNLGRPPFWRVRAGWYDSAGSWSAAAVQDFQTRFQAFREREARRALQARVMADAERSVAQTTITEAARDEYQTLLRRIEAVEQALRIRD